MSRSASRSNWNPAYDMTPETVALRNAMLTGYRPRPSAGYVASPTGDDHSDYDYRRVIASGNQGGQGSCTANGVTSAIEQLIWMATGQVVALSRQWLYIMAQNARGIRTDSGSSITESINIAMTIGVPLEKYQPYPSRYTRKIERKATEQASHCKLKDAVRLETFEDIAQWHRQREGSIVAGMAWGGTMSNAGPRIETFRPGGGGHCVCWPQITPGTEHNEDPDIDLDNSHGDRWGDSGVAAMSPRTVRGILDHKMTSEFGGVIGLRGVELSGPDFTDPLDDGKGGMVA